MAEIQTIKRSLSPLEHYGKSFETGLARLAQNKINELNHQQNIQRTARGLRALQQGERGIDQETAEALAELEPSLLREYVKGAVNPKQSLIQQQIGGPLSIGQESFSDYNKSLTKRLKNVDEGVNVISRLKDKIPQINKTLWGKGKHDLEFENDLAELERLYPEYKGLSKRIKSGTPKEVIQKELDHILKNINKPRQEQEALQEILKNSGGQVPQDYSEQIKNYLEEKDILHRASASDVEPEEQLAENPQAESGYGLSDIARVPAALAARGVQGLGEGLTGTAALPFNLANLVSGGRIPVPQAVQSLERAPGAAVKALTGDLTTPKSDIEGAVGEAVSDVASFLSPSGFLGVAGKGASLLGKGSKWLNAASKALKVPVKSAAAISGLSNTAKYLTKKIGGNEAQQDAAKVGTLIASTVLGPRFITGEATKIANQAIAELPEGTKIISAPVYNKIGTIYNELSKGEITPLKKSLLDQLSSLEKDQSVGKLWQLRNTADAAARDTSLPKKVQQILPKLSEDITNAFSKLVPKYPEFGKKFEQYRDLENAFKTSNKFIDFASKNLNEGISRNPKLTFGLKILGLPKYATIAAIGAPAVVAGEAERVGQMLYKSPKFRELYTHVINAGLQGNRNELNKLVPKFAEEAEKSK